MRSLSLLSSGMIILCVCGWKTQMSSRHSSRRMSITSSQSVNLAQTLSVPLSFQSRTRGRELELTKFATSHVAVLLTIYDKQDCDTQPIN